MTKEKKIIVIVTIISILLIVILSYLLINKNAIIKKQAEEMKLQAMEINGSNSYITTEKHLNEISQNTSKMKRKLIAENVNNQGTYTSCSDGTKLSDLGDLDITNFGCIPKNVSGSGMVSDRGWYTASSSSNPYLSYNNGTLSISGLSVTSYDGVRQWNSSTVTVDIYVYYCD